MIVVQLTGGLGNQMFQYAAGYALSVRHHVPLGLDLSEFPKHPLRTFRLDHFCIDGRVIPSWLARFLTRNHGERRIERLVSAAAHRFEPRYRHEILEERHFHFDPNILTASAQTYLVGYWQSYRYFDAVSEQLRRRLSLRKPLGSTSQVIASKIAERPSVSIHVRRGDYVADAEQSAIHGACGVEYYRKAVDIVANTIGDMQLFVFSDDFLWTKANLCFPIPTIFVDQNGPERDYEDMILMAMCDHHIIANSSFSWWGAWLCASRDQLVIAPAQWFANDEHNIEDLCPNHWIRI
mgnify:CR=1 FL=1